MENFEIERTLSGVIDQFVLLQKWAAKPDASRKLDQVFSVILRLREKLKLLEKMDRSHPLQGLTREIRAEFDTREFRAVLLAAFNWRSAKKKRKQVGAAAVKEQYATARSKAREIPNRAVKRASVLAVAKKTSVAARPKGREVSGETLTRPAKDQAIIDNLTRDLIGFLDRSFRIFGDVSTTLGRRKVADNIDFYRAGRRLPGSYGSNQ
jgi:DNA mismatch repair ATPase MutS